MEGSVRGIPENSSRVIPRLFCSEPGTAIDFYVDVLGAVELGRRPGSDGSVAHALLTIGGEMLMVEAEWPSIPSRAPARDGSSPVVIFVYLSDVDATVARAVDAGARLLVPAQDQFWGDRTAWIMDPAGHVWTLATRVEDTTEAEREARWSRALEEGSRAADDQAA